MANSPHIRLSIEGTIQNTQSWSTGVSVQGPAGAPTQAQWLAWLTDVQAAFATYHDAANGAMHAISSQVSVKNLRAYYYPAGQTTSSGEGSVTSPFTGPDSAVLPAQCSVVHSLRTASTSRHGRGRMYIPALAAPMSSATLRLGTGVAGPYATALAAFLSSIGGLAIDSVPTAPVIAPRGAGALIPIVTVQVDNVIDTQRNRRNKILYTDRGIANL